MIEKVTQAERISKLILKTFSVPDPSVFQDSIGVEDYANKLSHMALTYVKTIMDEDVGFISFYANDAETKTAYIALFGVLPKYRGKMIAHILMDRCITECKKLEMKSLRLEVENYNLRAVEFYSKYHFKVEEKISEESIYMIRSL